MSRPRLRHIVARALGIHTVCDDATALATALERIRTALWARQRQEALAAARQLRTPLAFQSPLVDVYRDQVNNSVRLNTLAAAAETNLNLDSADRRAVYQSLIDAARQSESMERVLAAAVAGTLVDTAEALASRR